MRAVDLFCGAGGLSRGLSSSGMDIVVAYDNWQTAIEVYSKNMTHKVECVDLLDVDTATERIKQLKPDIIVGGPPCQDFSSAGKRIEGHRASLTMAYAQIVKQCKPSLALMENVPRTRLSDTYKRARGLLTTSGYRTFEFVLDASLCGVPQLRKRFFVLAWQGGNGLGERMKSWMTHALDKKALTVKEYMKEEIGVEFYYRHARNYSRRAIFGVQEPSPTIRGVNRPVPPNYKRNHLDSADPECVRSLTSEERSRIQTFPRHWKWAGKRKGSLTKSDMELLIGNSVPINMARFVGKGILYASG